MFINARLFQVGMKILRSYRPLTVLAILVALIAAFATGWYSSRITTTSQMSNNNVQPVRFNDPEYPFISPLVSVAIPNAKGFPELESVKQSVTEIINKAKATDGVSRVSVYIRLPTNAHWLGINENDTFDPGSLIKVPIMLAYLKQAETTPAILEMKLRYTPSSAKKLPNALPAQLSAGIYSASKLLEAMIIHSDNTSKDILTDRLQSGALQEVFDEMNANFLKDPSGTISAKSYIIILARIYSATYLNRYYSNYAMQLLTKTTFKDGIVAGIPADVKVAHKYGERGVYEDQVLTAIELHDCGLVYNPGNPYYICVMTEGKDPSALAGVIRDISAATYRDRDAFMPQK